MPLAMAAPWPGRGGQQTHRDRPQHQHVNDVKEARPGPAGPGIVAVRLGDDGLHLPTDLRGFLIALKLEELELGGVACAGQG